MAKRGRPRKSAAAATEYKSLIEELSPLKRKFLLAMKKGIDDGNPSILKIYASYAFGTPQSQKESESAKGEGHVSKIIISAATSTPILTPEGDIEPLLDTDELKKQKWGVKKTRIRPVPSEEEKIERQRIEGNHGLTRGLGDSEEEIERDLVRNFKKTIRYDQQQAAKDALKGVKVYSPDELGGITKINTDDTSDSDSVDGKLADS